MLVNLEQALIYELKSFPAFDGRVYPLAAPETNAKSGIPYCIIVTSEGLRDKSMDGYGSGKLVSAEINIVTERYAEMKALAGPVIDLLTRMELRVIGAGGPFIQELTYSAPVELYEDKPKLYRCVIDFEVYFIGG